MSDKYVLVNGEPAKELDLIKWAQWFESSDRIVEQTQIRDVTVSTVFLALNHNYGKGEPLIYETMVFKGPLDGEMNRYATKEQAIEGHRIMVEKVKAKEVA